MAEYMDMFVAPGLSPDEIMQRLNQALPPGLRIMEAKRIEIKAPSLSTIIDSTRYRIILAEEWSTRLARLCLDFLERDECIIQRKKKGETQSIDLRAEVTELIADGSTMNLVSRRGKAIEFCHAITGDPTLRADDIRVEKLEVIFSA